MEVTLELRMGLVKDSSPWLDNTGHEFVTMVTKLRSHNPLLKLPCQREDLDGSDTRIEPGTGQGLESMT
ncbi:hypothetical protein TNCV_2516021 [Trichonephila clavipes]|nr:hypothetical protein TNCV_2516021 [Trichonephila clavipes]